MTVCVNLVHIIAARPSPCVVEATPRTDAECQVAWLNVTVLQQHGTCTPACRVETRRSTIHVCMYSGVTLSHTLDAS